jgi:hypothetical protein
MKSAIAISLILILSVGRAHGQLRPPDRVIAPISDPSMVVIDRGSELEIIPAQRAAPESDAAGHTVHRVSASPADAPIGPHELGVVFNHSMQKQGYFTGEIAFKMKAGRPVGAVKASHYPQIRKITDPAVYVLNARTPAEFLAVLKRLQGRHDLEWVEPTIIYGPQVSGSYSE